MEGNDEGCRLCSASVMFDDTDWNQAGEASGLSDGNGELVYGGYHACVERMNEGTSAMLRTIAVPRTACPRDYGYKPEGERWYASSVMWDVREEIASAYGVKIEIEQGRLYYRGTWLRITASSPLMDEGGLLEACRKFCADSGIDERKELEVQDAYALPWTEDQERRREEDDAADFFFDAME